MPCYNPMQAYYQYAEDGSRQVKFSNIAAEMFSKGMELPDDYFGLPCGKCNGCRLEKSRVWAVRCMHEASLYDDNCFVTLTYRDECVPVDGSLRKRDFQLFMKRLRKQCMPEMPDGMSFENEEKWLADNAIRYYQCGEYGESFSRPHYHACIFNYDFPDKVFWKKSNDGDLYVSESLERLWGLGFCTVAALTFDSAAYVARYCMKKVNGSMADSHYEGREPEYACMSRRPGIGRRWFDKYWKDCYPSDYLVMNGVKMKPPRFYDDCYDDRFPGLIGDIKARRLTNAVKRSYDNTFRRLKDREKCKDLKVTKLVRKFEKEIFV